MRQETDEVSNTFFSFYNSFPVHTVDGLVMIYYPGNEFFFFFLHFMSTPLSVTGTPL